MKVYRHSFIFALVLITSLACFSLHAEEKTSKVAHPKKDGKTRAYMGDPAQKRGYELGLDLGFKAGKSDKKEGKKNNPTAHEDYKNAIKKFRSEYGIQSHFLAGYSAGFNKGYRSGFSLGKESPVKEKKKSEGNTKESTPPKKVIRDKKFNPADDAL
ncbi:MAG: hypothetical protein HQM15_11610 [Deltaproteobacteria bacterium]|nr:hypothetical protein [Deltaproteobacteria bacterium]